MQCLARRPEIASQWSLLLTDAQPDKQQQHLNRCNMRQAGRIHFPLQSPRLLQLQPAAARPLPCAVFTSPQLMQLRYLHEARRTHTHRNTLINTCIRTNGFLPSLSIYSFLKQTHICTTIHTCMHTHTRKHTEEHMHTHNYFLVVTLTTHLPFLTTRIHAQPYTHARTHTHTPMKTHKHMETH